MGTRQGNSRVPPPTMNARPVPDQALHGAILPVPPAQSTPAFGMVRAWRRAGCRPGAGGWQRAINGLNHGHVLLLVLALCWSAAGLAAPAVDQNGATVRFAQRIDAIFADMSGDRPGYAVGVVSNGRLAIFRAYGVADLETRAPITADTAFNLASLSKQFTAAAVAREIVRGRIGLDDPLGRHWPGLPAFLQPVTIGHLIYMTSGIPEYFTLPSPKGGWTSEDRFTVRDSLSAVFKADRLLFQPGSRWAYNNSNYQLLAALVARLNRTDFPTHMARAVFQPLQMRHSWVDAPLQKRASMARSYVPAAFGAGWREAPRLSPHYGGSGMFSTINDLARWDAALFRDRALGDRFSRLMLSTRRYAHPKANDAFGLVHGQRGGVATLWYEGGDYGVSTFMIRVPAHRLTVICLANFAEANCASRANQIVDAALEDMPAPLVRAPG
jgi:CubicO group peptidase (beta-lactamase class C family)